MAVDLKKIPLKDIQARLARARTMDLAKLTDDQVRTRISRLMDGYSTVPLALQTNQMFRARANPSEQPFENASDIWYPPAHVATRNRFNEPGKPVFYLTNRFHAAVFEIRPQLQSIVTVLTVRHRGFPEALSCAQIGVERCTAPEVVNRRIAIREAPSIKALLKDRDYAKRWLAIDRYLGDIATDECPPDMADLRFKPTNALANLLLAIPGVDALHYPSVAVGMKAVNLAMLPGRADKLFYPGEAWMLRVEDFRRDLEGAPHSQQGYYAVRFLQRTGEIPHDGKLNWRPVNNDPMPSYMMREPLY